MDVKQFAKRYEWQGATFYFLPYRGLPVDMALRGLNEIEPDAEWVNTKTGERVVGDEPEALVKKRVNAEKLGIPLKSDWQRNRLWNLTHDTFYLCLPSIVAIDFPEVDDRTPLELRMFAAYWNEPGKTVAERWANFKQIIGTATTNALWDGYMATRENLAPGKPELGQVEPKEPFLDSSGSEAETISTSS